MARYTGPSCKLCRREGTKLYLKGDRCLSDKCAFARRATAPGPHGADRKKVGEYGMQMREKQKARRYYGVLEKQFKKYYVEADRQSGVAGENLLRLLERRLDNVVYRIGFGESRKEARQLLLHGHIELNGKKANIPSILVKAGDVITVKAGDSEKLKGLAENLGANAPKWIEVDKANAQAKIIALPERDDVDFEFNEQLIIELYSK